MRLTAQEEYGLRCLLRVGRGGTVTIGELSRAEGITEPNVAKMMRVLRRSGFVQSTRGQAGGYSLARPAGEIRLVDVLSALGGRLYEPSFCDDHTGVERLCTHMTDCSIRSVWRLVQRAVDDVLAKITLKDLLVSETEMNTFSSSDGSGTLPAYRPPA
jgi:Rrf2 family protein